MNIVVESMWGPSMEEREVEIVEHKGTGHPDSICDGVVEAVSVALNRAYVERFGNVLHNNIDKGLLIAGQVEKWFGGGRVIRPMELVIGDRATRRFGGQELPVEEIALEAARDWLGRHLPQLRPAKDVDIRIALAPASEQLSGIYTRKARILPANDTSAAIGYWPLTATERAVLDLGHWIGCSEFKKEFPEAGDDVKVMGVRHLRLLELTVAVPLLCSRISSEREYFTRKAALREKILGWCQHIPFDTAVYLNALDESGQGLRGVYLSFLGTSAEDADSGQVGRGNRVNGLIPVNRPIGTEAFAGKNPFSHVGKIYNVLAFRAARAICETLEEVQEAEVSLVSRIGQPIDKPCLASARLLPGAGVDFPDLRRRTEAVLQEELASIPDLCRSIAKGELFVM